MPTERAGTLKTQEHNQRCILQGLVADFLVGKGICASHSSIIISQDDSAEAAEQQRLIVSGVYRRKDRHHQLTLSHSQQNLLFVITD